MKKERDRLHARLDETLDLLEADNGGLQGSSRWFLFIRTIDAVFDLIAGTP